MNPKEQNPQNQPKKKKEKTAEEKAEARRKAEEKKKLKKEQARLEEEKKKKEGATPEQAKSQENKKKKNDGKAPEQPKPQEKKENKEEQVVKKKRIYALTTFEERSEQLKLPCDKNNKNITSSDIIDILSKDHKNHLKPSEYSHMNEEIIIALEKITKTGLHKQAKTCLDLCEGIINFIEGTNGDSSQVTYEIKMFLEQIIKTVYQITEVNAGLDNTLHYLKKVKELLNKVQPKEPVNEIKQRIIGAINDFINRKINTKATIYDKIGNQLIKDGDFILIYGKSKIFRSILTKAVANGIKFKLLFVDDRKQNQIKSEVEFLSKLGITVVYTYLNGVSAIIHKVTKVFIKGKSMLSNGNLQGQLGTSLLACIANNFQKPVIAFCQTYKFWDKIMLNSLQQKNSRTIQIEEGKDLFKQLEMEYDITPANFISMVVCELGHIPATSVPVVIREFWEKEID